MGAILCFALFLGAVGACLALGWQLTWAVWLGIAVFAVLGLRRGVPAKRMAESAWAQGKKMCAIIGIYLLIGAITALWRSAGTIAFFIYYGLQIITPQLFLLVAFLLTSLISYALGTSFGVVGTVGVILLALARSGGVDASMAAGTVIAGAYFGDRCSPASSSAALVAAATGTRLYDNLRRMHRTGWLPYLVSLAVYGVLSVTHPLSVVDAGVLEELAAAYRLDWWTVLPAAAIVVLPLCRVSIRRSMAVSVVLALAVTIWGQGGAWLPVLRDTVLGYRPAPGALQEVLAGGGVVSMLSATVLAVSTGLYAGLLDGAGVLDRVRHKAAGLARRIGRFPACAAVCVVSGMVFCNQSTGAVVSTQLMEETYRQEGGGNDELALDIENSGIVLSPLIPWNISGSIPLTMLGADISAIPFEVLLYVIPLCYLLMKRRVFPAKGESAHDQTAGPMVHS